MNFRQLLQKQRDDDALTHVMFELTYACELKCTFCYNDKQKKGRAFTLADHRRVLDELAEKQVLFVTYTGGEPLAHKHFFEIAGAAKERGFVVRIKSHGARIDQATAERLRNEVDPSRIDMSLHGACAETHERQTRVSGSFEKLKRALRALRAVEIPVRLNATLTRFNENEIAAMFKLADDHQVPLFFDPHVTDRDNGDQSPREIAASNEGMLRLLSVRQSRVRTPETASPTPRPKVVVDERKRHCGAGASSAHVDPFGNVTPCVQWKVPLGNLHDEAFTEIWKSQAVQKVRGENAAALSLVQREQRKAYCPGAAHRERGKATRAYSTSDRLRILDA